MLKCQIWTSLVIFIFDFLIKPPQPSTGLFFIWVLQENWVTNEKPKKDHVRVGTFKNPHNGLLVLLCNAKFPKGGTSLLLFCPWDLMENLVAKSLTSLLPPPLSKVKREIVMENPVIKSPFTPSPKKWRKVNLPEPQFFVPTSWNLVWTSGEMSYCGTGWARLIQSHSSASISFKLSRNTN